MRKSILVAAAFCLVLLVPAATAKTVNVDLNSVFEGAASQFRGLNPNEPGQWPILPKVVTWAAVAVMVILVGWFLLLSTAHDELDADTAMQEEVRNAAHALTHAVAQSRRGEIKQPDEGLNEPRQK